MLKAVKTKVSELWGLMSDLINVFLLGSVQFFIAVVILPTLILKYSRVGVMFENFNKTLLERIIMAAIFK